MAISKMRAKPRKAAVKRIKVTNGGDLDLGKLLVNRINRDHRNIRKQRERKLKAKRSTTLSDIHTNLRPIL